MCAQSVADLFHGVHLVQLQTASSLQKCSLPCEPFTCTHIHVWMCLQLATLPPISYTMLTH